MTEKRWSAAELEALKLTQRLQIEDFEAREAQVSNSDRRPITSPGKFSFPVGMDDQGNFFPNEIRRSRSSAPRADSEPEQTDESRSAGR